MSSTRVRKIRSIGRGICTELAKDVKYILVGDLVATGLMYGYTALIGAVYAAYLWPSLVIHGTAIAVLLTVTIVLLIVPILVLAIVVSVILSYNTFGAIADASQPARQARGDLRRAAWYASRWRSLPTRSKREFKAEPLFIGMAQPSKEFVRFEKTKYDLRKSYQFLERGAHDARFGLWSRVLVRKAKRKHVSIDMRLNAMYQALYTGIVNEYKNSLGGPVQLDVTDSVWVLPGTIGSPYSVRILENFAETVGTLSDNNRRLAPHIRLIFAPAWVCEMVSKLEKNYRGSLPPSVWQRNETACVPLQGADPEIVAKLYDPKGCLSDLNTLIDTALHI